MFVCQLNNDIQARISKAAEKYYSVEFPEESEKVIASWIDNILCEKVCNINDIDFMQYVDEDIKKVLSASFCEK